MSKEYVIETISQPSLYDPQPRKINVYVSLPKETDRKICNGIVLFIAGFGGHSNSNVFIKMRKIFSDEYNLITVQTDYFGYEFMQQEIIQETPANFCDMGPVQAMDQLIALKAVSDFLDDNEIKYEKNNVIAYGYSHGGYIALLMNAFMPGVLSCVIDNSAWIYPLYVSALRIVKDRTFNYLLSRIIMDNMIYDIRHLYSCVKNETNIFSFHGIDDTMAPIEEKFILCSEVDRMSLEVIGESKIDNVRFSRSDHGLGADFLELFRYVMSRYNTKLDKPVLNFKDRDFSTINAEYRIRNEDGIPILYYNLLKEYDFEALK